MLSSLTIVTITFNNEDELDATLKSCSVLRKNGCKQLVQNGGEYLMRKDENLLIFNEKDNGIYDALEKGMSKADTKYVLNIHSGDKFVGKADELIEILADMDARELDISLNDQMIPFGKITQNRIHSAQKWKPYMLSIGVQPPHMPTIFRREFAKRVKYRLNEPVIGDYFQFVDLFKLSPKWAAHGRLLVRMAPGGHTTRGLASFIFVSQQFMKSHGFLRGLLMAVFRVPFKLLQATRL